MSSQILPESPINPANEDQKWSHVICDELGTVENEVKYKVIEAIMPFIPKKSLNRLHDECLFQYNQRSIVLLINDKQIKQYKVSINGRTEIISIIHFDFFVKGTNECLYGILMNPNKWELDEFLTAKQILTEYHIQHQQLPPSSLKMDIFINQMEQKLNVDEFEGVVDETNWSDIPIKSHSGSVCSVTMQLTLKMWTVECKKSFQNKHLPLIPVIVTKDDKHWIEWIKIIEILCENGKYYLGVSYRYNNKQWNVELIYLDIDDIYNGHGLIDDELRYFKSSIEAIEFKEDLNDNEYKDDDMEQLETVNLLRREYTSNENKIDILQKILASFTEAEQHENNKAVHVDAADIDDNDDDNNNTIYYDTGLEIQSDWEEE